MNGPRRGRPPLILGKEKRLSQERWEWKIQKEKERMRQEREQYIWPSGLTEEQKHIRRIIQQRGRKDRKPTGKLFGRTRPRPTQKGEEAKIAEADSDPRLNPPRSKKPYRLLSAEDQRRWDAWEQRIGEEEERMREEFKQRICPSNLTEEQKRIRGVISNRTRRRRLKEGWRLKRWIRRQ